MIIESMSSIVIEGIQQEPALLRDESAESLHRVDDQRIDWIQLVVNQLLPMSVDGQNSPSHLT